MLPLVVAKTARPQMVRASVIRPRLLDLLDAAVSKPVTVVCAGAGWGKTMLVSAWAETRRAPVGWLSLDQHDNDPQIFWAYAVAALRVAGVLEPDNPLARMGSAPSEERERGRRLAAGLSRVPPGAVLVVDDFHEIDDAEVLREMSDLLRHPLPLRLVLVTRSEPPLTLNRLHAAGQVARVGAPDLAFTGAEAAALIGGHGLDLSPEDVATLLHRTEGWAAGLQLGAGFLADHGEARSIADFAGDIRGVGEYLTEEVLAARSRRQRRFLLQTSICEHLCADLANAITMRGDAQRTLEQLEHDNDFVVRLGAKPLWFRYHHLMRDVLGHRLQLEAPASVPELHRRAARWYAANNSIMEALTHAVSARDWPYLGRLVTNQGATLILSAHRAALVKILQQVPPENLTSTPELMVCAALLALDAGNYGVLPAYVARARGALQDRPEPERRPVEIMLLLLQVSADRAIGNMPSVSAVSTELLTLLAAASFTETSTVAQQRAAAMSNRGVALLWSGAPDEAERQLWTAATAARAAGLELAEINAAGHLALLQVMSGSVHEAAQLAGGARDLAEARGWQYTVQAVAAHLAHALVHLERDDLDAAHQALQQGIRAYHSRSEAAQSMILRGVQARLALARGENTKARQFLEQASRDRDPRLSAPTIDRWLSLIEADLDLAGGAPDRVDQRFAEQEPTLAQRVRLARAALARRKLGRAELLLQPTGTAMSETVATVSAGIVAALVADLRGHVAGAVDLLAGAVRLAAREGIRRPFADMSGPRLDGLLDRLRLLTPEDAPLAADIMGDVRATTASSPTAETLTEREAEVLRFLPTMLTAAEVAAALGVSVNTVKAHTRSIYRKLGASRRSEAVAEAGERGIL